MVISQFRLRGPGGGSDEYIELLNASGLPVALGGWRINGSSASAITSTRATLPQPLVLMPLQHYLLAHNNYSGTVPADQSYGAGISDDGGIALVNGQGAAVDQVGLSVGSAYGEGSPLAPQAVNADRAYRRRLGGAQDAGDNAGDFEAVDGAAPHNAASPAESIVCDAATATPTSTASPTPTSTPTAMPTPTPAVDTSAYINEIDSDTPGTDTAEFIEVNDGRAGNTPLDGLTVVLFNGGDGRSYRAIDLAGHTSDGSGLFVIGGAGVPGAGIIIPTGALQNGVDAVALFAGRASDFPNGTTVTEALASRSPLDGVVYDTGTGSDPILQRLLNPGQPPVNEDAIDKDAHSSQRCLGGAPPYRNTSDFAEDAPSPGRPNPCAALVGMVWDDVNGDGVRGTGESGVEGITVIASRAAAPRAPQGAQDTSVVSGSTAAGGLFTLTSLLPGPHYVTLNLPAGRYLGPRDRGGNDATDSDFDPASGRSPTYQLTLGLNAPKLAAGLSSRPTAITLLAFTAEPLSAAKCASASGSSCARIAWSVSEASGVVGYRLLRAADSAERSTAMAVGPTIPGEGGGPASYVWIDTETAAGTYWYWMLELDADGPGAEYGPTSVTLAGDEDP